MTNLEEIKIKLAKTGLDNNQIEQLLNQGQIEEDTINDLCAILEKINYKFIKKHNKKH